jgi:predicted RNA-binding Zn ribbon-like protein
MKKREPTRSPLADLGVADARLCLDFVNTEGLERNSPPDRLESLDLFLDWAARHGLVDRASARTLAAARRAKAVESFLQRARVLREALYRVLSALSAGARPPREELAIVNRELAEGLPGLRLDWVQQKVRLVPADQPVALEGLLWPIAASAADLARSPLLDRLKECRSDGCSWMFIDESKNRSRRWCDMADCGNRAKARRYYHRHSEKRPG